MKAPTKPQEKPARKPVLLEDVVKRLLNSPPEHRAATRPQTNKNRAEK